MIFKILLKLILNVDYKKLRVAQVFQKRFEFFLKDGFFILKTIFILSLSQANALIKNWDSKQNIICSNYLVIIKIVFILLTKMVLVNI